MKGVVLEVRDGCSAILLEDGTVVKRPTTYGIGETIEVEATVTKMPSKTRLSRIVAAVAAFTVVFTGGGTYAYLDATAMSQISLDVNPSLEYELNHFDRIVSVKDDNDDAKEVVDQLYEEGVKGDTLTEALAKTEDILKDLGYLAEDDDPYILVSVCSGSQKKYAELTAEIESQLSSEAYNVTVLAISEENKKEAEELGLSGGRYAIMKSDEEKMVTAKADEKEKKPADAKMDMDPVEYYKTSAVKTLIEGITEDSLTIDDDDTIETEVADTSDKEKEKKTEEKHDGTTTPSVDAGVVATGEETTGEAAASTASSEAVSEETTTTTKPGKPDSGSVPADASAGSEESGSSDAVTVTTDETVATEEEPEETVTTGDDEVDGDEPIDMSKLG